MTLEMPEGLQKFASVVVGADWPEGDEDALRRLEEAWVAAAQEVESVLGDTEAAASSTLGTMKGETAKAFEEYAKKLTSGEEAPLPALQKLCEELGKACKEVAAEVEYTKISIIASLAILAAQVALMLAMAPFTFGASTAGIAAAQATTQAIVRGLMQALLQLIQQVVINVALNLAVDVGIQAGQRGAGDRDDWDEGKTAAAAKAGAAAGLGAGIAGGVFGGVTKGIGGALKGSKFMDKMPSKLTDGGALSQGAAFGGKGFIGAAEGTAGGTMGAAMNNEFQGSGHSEQTLGSGASSGALGGIAGGPVNYKGALDGVPDSTPWSSNSSESGVSTPDLAPGGSTPPPAPESTGSGTGSGDTGTATGSGPDLTTNPELTHNPWADTSAPPTPTDTGTSTGTGTGTGSGPDLTTNPELTHNPWADTSAPPTPTDTGTSTDTGSDLTPPPGRSSSGWDTFKGEILDPLADHGWQDTKDDTLKPPENWVPGPNIVNTFPDTFDTAPQEPEGSLPSNADEQKPKQDEHGLDLPDGPAKN